MNINGKMIGDREVVASLGRISDAVISRVKLVVYEKTFKLMRHVMQNKLAGQVLKRRTGTLARSIQRGTGVVHEGNRSIGVVGLGGAELKVVKYGAAHEYGATIPARVIEPTKKQALKFTVGGKTIFSKRCVIPSFKMKERSFLRSSLKEMEPEFVAAIKQAVAEGIRKGKA